MAVSFPNTLAAWPSNIVALYLAQSRAQCGFQGLALQVLKRNVPMPQQIGVIQLVMLRVASKCTGILTLLAGREIARLLVALVEIRQVVTAQV